MKKENRNGRISLKSYYFGKFYVNYGVVLKEFQDIQYYYANLGYLTTSTINLRQHRIELCIYFDEFTLPRPYSYNLYSYRELTSHTYWCEYDNKSVRVRCCTYYFEY